MKPRFDSEFSLTVECRLKVDGSQSWCFRCPYLKVSVKREFNVHVLVKGHIDDLPLSWELSYKACSTRRLSNFSSLTGTLKTDKKGYLSSIPCGNSPVGGMPGTPGGPIGMRPRPLPRIPMPPRPGDERKSLWCQSLQPKLWNNVILGTRDESLRMSSWEANVHTTRDEFSWLKTLTRLFVHKEPLNSFALFNFNCFIGFSFSVPNSSTSQSQHFAPRGLLDNRKI